MLLIMKELIAERIFLFFLSLVAVTLKKHPLFKGVQGRGEAEQMMNKVNSLFWRVKYEAVLCNLGFDESSKQKAFPTIMQFYNSWPTVMLHLCLLLSALVFSEKPGD